MWTNETKMPPKLTDNKTISVSNYQTKTGAKIRILILNCCGFIFCTEDSVKITGQGTMRKKNIFDNK